MLRETKSNRRSREFWEKVVAMIERGEAGVDQIAHRHGVRKTTLRWWASQLRKQGRAAIDLVPVRVAELERSAVRIDR